MNRYWSSLSDTPLRGARFLGVMAAAALAAFLFFLADAADAADVALGWAGWALAAAVLAWLLVWGARHFASTHAVRTEGAWGPHGGGGLPFMRVAKPGETPAPRARVQQAIQTIRRSRLGQHTGAAALYELPWFMVIGSPAAGKSTAVMQSGLTFPIADDEGRMLRGIGGTRDCDWFYTNEGILLDTAGRYALHEENRAEWLGLLASLRKYRAKAPVNGILIAASVAELLSAKPEASVLHAKLLRQRIQEMTERLEVVAPVYLVFTKADLISGFTEFFADCDDAQRNGVWGATLPYDTAKPLDAAEQFDRHFEQLHEGLKEAALARMARSRGAALPPGVMSFPLEFAALRPVLRAFIATLFDENLYQFPPVFRGFYFTSAARQGPASGHASEHVAAQFALSAPRQPAPASVAVEKGFFLKDLFSRVVFPDRHLVRPYASRGKQRLRAATFAVSAAALALALAAWSESFLANRQLMADVQADAEAAAREQAGHADLASRLQAMEMLQDRIEMFAAWHAHRPWSVSFGLYQGDAMEARLREEYFNGLRQLLLQPVAQALEGYLAEVNRSTVAMRPQAQLPESGATPLTTDATEAAMTPSPTRFVAASPTSVDDAYNALKTYLMLAERSRMEPGHLTDQITRFWRTWLEEHRGNMPRDAMIRSAERMLGFAMSSLQDPAFPVLDAKLGLIDQTRENLRRVVRGMPAQERVYAEIKARASTRFAPMSVARIMGESSRETLVGSHSISGTFTREAWEGYVEAAFKQAAASELQSVDWVLKTSSRDDLSLAGSPDQVEKALTDLYKAEYVREWQRFMQGVSVVEFGSLDAVVTQMGRLADPAGSPLKRLLATFVDQTSWDNPSLLQDHSGAPLAEARAGVVEWVRQTILGRAPAPREVRVEASRPNASNAVGPTGPARTTGAVGREFAALSLLVAPRDGGPAPVESYLKALGSVRSRFNAIQLEGDPGPSARQLMSATLDGGHSDLAEALRLVDEQMLPGMTDTARAALRPLLVRPLMQSFAALVPAAEVSINRDWDALVYAPFQRDLAPKFPFTASPVEAGPQEIARAFGPEGAIAKFVTSSLGTLVLRDGATVRPRTWAGMGVALRPEFTGGLATWVAALEGATAAQASSAADPSVTTFQMRPHAAPGLAEYSVEIDGQVLRYADAAPAWADLVWPHASDRPGVRISGITRSGEHVDLLNEPGRTGLQRMFELARRRHLAGGTHELSWGQGEQAVTLDLRVIREASEAPSKRATVGTGLHGLRLPALVAGTATPASAIAASSARDDATGAGTGAQP